MNCLIVSGGTVDKELLLKTWKEMDHPYVIGVDRGCIYLLENNISVNKAVGDFDSVNAQEKIIIDKFLDVVQLECEKDDTDTEHAIKMAIDMKVSKIVLLGCTGTRLDQTMSSIGLLKMAKDAGIDAFILDTHNRIHVEKGVCILTAADRFGDYISILPYGNKISGLSIRGFKYEARDLEIELASSRGVSNELTHDVGMITCDDYFVVMETKD